MDEGIKKLARYLISGNRNIRLEAEAKEERLRSFFEEYGNITNERLTFNTDGIVLLQDDADKWGLELRIYISDTTNFPQEYSRYLTTNTRFEEYYQAYDARLNNNNLIIQLIRIGFRIGNAQDVPLIRQNTR